MVKTQLPLETLAGTVERITFHSEETGFCVLRTSVKGQRELVTIVGSAATIHAGEFIECKGHWFNDRTYGLQFKTEYLHIVPPTTLEGIERYLASNMVKGIGPHFAKKLVQAFGAAVFDVIEKQPHRLTELEGIGQKRKKQVTDAWSQQKVIRDIMVFLHANGVGTARATRIYKTYGDEAIARVKENPYRLAKDIRGIGFKTADDLALRLGISPGAAIRAQAGVCHVLQNLCDRGHCAAEYQALVEASQDLLDIAGPVIEEAIQHQIEQKELVPDTIDGLDCIFPAALFHAETKVAEYLLALKRGILPWGAIDMPKEVALAEKETVLKLSASQHRSLMTVLQHKVSIITGGPGVGKTTIVNSLVNILQRKHLKIHLCAPTGRAAKRMSEATGLQAKTIHRLLDFDPIRYAFKHHQDHPLPLDVLIIDESSMMDVSLFYQLLKAVPKKAALVLVGDVDQLPSVGPGLVLNDLIRSASITTVHLTEIFRQAAASDIILNAHRMNRGQLPSANAGKQSDFFTLYEEDAESIHTTLIQLVSQRLPRHYRCHPVRDIQVLVPMNRGGLGTHSLNLDLQKALNGRSDVKLTRYGTTFAIGDKVIQMVNNYDKDVFNGDIGWIESIDMEEKQMSIRFDGRVVMYESDVLDEIRLAYAISIHKSQGSEFPMVVIPIAMQHYALLARNLIYTAVTRGRQLVVLVGQKKAIGMAVRNARDGRRLTKLAHRMGGSNGS